MNNEKHKLILSNLIKIQKETGKGLKGWNLISKVAQWLDIKSETAKTYVRDLQLLNYIENGDIDFVVSNEGIKFLEMK